MPELCDVKGVAFEEARENGAEATEEDGDKIEVGTLTVDGLRGMYRDVLAIALFPSELIGEKEAGTVATDTAWA